MIMSRYRIPALRLALVAILVVLSGRSSATSIDHDVKQESAVSAVSQESQESAPAVKLAGSGGLRRPSHPQAGQSHRDRDRDRDPTGRLLAMKLNQQQAIAQVKARLQQAHYAQQVNRDSGSNSLQSNEAAVTTGNSFEAQSRARPGPAVTPVSPHHKTSMYMSAHVPQFDFDTCFQTKYLADITNKESFEGLEFSMFRAVTTTGKASSNLVLDESNPSIQFHSCERLAINKQQGLGFSTMILSRESESNFTVHTTPLRLEGLPWRSEDPRLFTIGDRVYVAMVKVGDGVGIAVSPFETYEPLHLRAQTFKNPVEKNWAPFEQNGKLMFIYNFDPLIVIACDMAAKKTECDIVHKESDVQMPFDTRFTHLRGGSNLVPLVPGQTRYLLAGCHSRMQKPAGAYYHFTHMVVVDSQEWKIVHLSKPLAYNYNGQKVGIHGNATMKFIRVPTPGSNGSSSAMSILMERSSNGKSLIQDPVSLVGPFTKATHPGNVFFYLSANIKDAVSLLYELSVSKSCAPGSMLFNASVLVGTMGRNKPAGIDEEIGAPGPRRHGRHGNNDPFDRETLHMGLRLIKDILSVGF